MLTLRAIVLTLTTLSVVSVECDAQAAGFQYGVVHSQSLAARSHLDVVEPARFGSVEFNATLVVARGGWWHAEYGFGLIPLAWVRGSFREAIILIPPDRLFGVDGGRATRYAVGVRPVALSIVLGLEAVALEFSADGSVLRFSSPIPAANGARTNFAGSVGAGMRVRLPVGYLSFGYRFSHLSNAGRARFNPGLESHLIHMGVWWH